MNIRISSMTLNAAATLFQAENPGFTPAVLREALKAYKPEGATIEQPKQRLLTRREAADRLSVSLQSVNRYLRDGILRRVKVGPRLVRIDPASVEGLLQMQTATEMEA